MHEALHTLDEVRPLRAPILIAAFSGLNDFGGAAIATIDHLSEAWGARDLAEITPEPFFDFTVQRPVVRLAGETRVIDWPVPTFRVASPEGAGSRLPAAQERGARTCAGGPSPRPSLT